MDLKDIEFESTSLENFDDYQEDRVKNLIKEFIELDGDILLYKDILIEEVEAIDFSTEDAFETVIQLIETYYANKESCIEVIEEHNTEIKFGEGIVNEYTIKKLKTFEDVEFLLEEPWKSSALRKLWKAISSIEFRDMWEDVNIALAIDILEIVLLVTDEDGHVQVSFDDWIEERKDASSPIAE